jgi:L-asparaginase II
MTRKAARRTAGRSSRSEKIAARPRGKTKPRQGQAARRAKRPAARKAPASKTGLRKAAAVKPAAKAAGRAAASANPILIEVTRGEMVESRHRVAAAILDADGKVVESWGDIDRPIYGRSAVKPLQALPLIETGAADAYGLGEAEIALACASHNGQPHHTERVKAWLMRIGCSVADLECGPHLPIHEPTMLKLVANGGEVTALYNNCSGKHAGFLTTARHRGEPVQGYIRFEHPVQQRVTKAMSEMTGLDLARGPRGIDGCGIPVLGVPLRQMAHALARMANPSKLPAERAAACRRITAAMMAWPMLVGGSGRFGSGLMASLKGRFALKGGAEGVYAGILPTLGLGVALKADDGAGRAADAAMAQLLRRLELVSPAEAKALRDVMAPPILNRAHLEVGRIRPVAGAGF